MSVKTKPGAYCWTGHGILEMGSLVVEDKENSSVFCLDCALKRGLIGREEYDKLKEEEMELKIKAHESRAEELKKDLKK
jgi:hypothetical protein